MLLIPFDGIPRNELLWKDVINLKYGGKYVADKGRGWQRSQTSHVLSMEMKKCDLQIRLAKGFGPLLEVPQL